MAVRRLPPSPRRTGPRVVGAPSAQYEFNEVENAVIANTASAASKWGWTLTIFSILGILGGLAFIYFAIVGWSVTGFKGLLYALGTLLGPLFFLFIGSMFRSAAQYFYDVVNSEGNDIKLMMRALERLGIVLFAQFFLVMFMLALGVIGGVVIYFVLS
jgi:hypothetical protein